MHLHHSFSRTCNACRGTLARSRHGACQGFPCFCVAEYWDRQIVPGKGGHKKALRSAALHLPQRRLLAAPVVQAGPTGESQAHRIGSQPAHDGRQFSSLVRPAAQLRQPLGGPQPAEIGKPQHRLGAWAEKQQRHPGYGLGRSLAGRAPGGGVHLGVVQAGGGLRPGRDGRGGHRVKWLYGEVAKPHRQPKETTMTEDSMALIRADATGRRR